MYVHSVYLIGKHLLRTGGKGFDFSIRVAHPGGVEGDLGDLLGRRGPAEDRLPGEVNVGRVHLEGGGLGGGHAYGQPVGVGVQISAQKIRRADNVHAADGGGGSCLIDPDLQQTGVGGREEHVEEGVIHRGIVRRVQAQQSGREVLEQIGFVEEGRQLLPPGGVEEHVHRHAGGGRQGLELVVGRGQRPFHKPAGAVLFDDAVFQK